MILTGLEFGKYFIGDPAYVLTQINYDKFVKETKNKEIGIIGQEDDHAKLILFQEFSSPGIVQYINSTIVVTHYLCVIPLECLDNLGGVNYGIVLNMPKDFECVFGEGKVKMDKEIIR